MSFLTSSSPTLASGWKTAPMAILQRSAVSPEEGILYIVIRTCRGVAFPQSLVMYDERDGGGKVSELGRESYLMT